MAYKPMLQPLVTKQNLITCVIGCSESLNFKCHNCKSRKHSLQWISYLRAEVLMLLYEWTMLFKGTYRIFSAVAFEVIDDPANNLLSLSKWLKRRIEVQYCAFVSEVCVCVCVCVLCVLCVVACFCIHVLVCLHFKWPFSQIFCKRIGGRHKIQIASYRWRTAGIYEVGTSCL